MDDFQDIEIVGIAKAESSSGLSLSWGSDESDYLLVEYLGSSIFIPVDVASSLVELLEMFINDYRERNNG